MNLIEKYNINVPRYTSYPTAPHFNSSFKSDRYVHFLSSIKEEERVSLYIHIPFCHQLCWYCGCNTKVVSKYAPVERYVDVLLKEIETVAQHMPQGVKVSHLHFGGGTPTMLKTSDFSKIYKAIERLFVFEKDAEKAVEIDPRSFTPDMADTLMSCGMNRVSFGVQDFDFKVQQAIHREQPFEMVRSVVNMLKNRQIDAINFDLIYGLPLQTEATIEETIAKTLELSPRRIALFGYAHVPWMKKHQQLLEKYDLPTAQQRLKFFDLASNLLMMNGYVQVGLDHFAREDDALVLAQRNGNLYRNFQGYTVDSAKTLLAFGASSIGELPQGFVQNHTSVKSYIEAVESCGFGTEKGLEKTDDDCLRSILIERIMCDYSIDFKDILLPDDFEYNTDFLAEMETDGLVVWQGEKLTVTPKGKPYVRLVASVFDAYLHANLARHSAAV